MAHEAYFDRGGKFMERRRQLLFGVDIDVVDEIPAEPSPALRASIIEFAIKNPGSAQKQLRAIKSTLEELQRIAKDHVPQLTQQHLESLIQAAAPVNITRPSEIEDNLRVLLTDPSSTLDIDIFVSPEKRAEITENAPHKIKLDDGSFIHLKYKNKRPLASRYSDAAILKLSEPPTLADGRIILFTRPHTKRTYQLHEVQELIVLHDSED